MKIMNMPGFAAENSIGASSHITYRTTTRYASGTSASILPQGITCVPVCDADGDCGYMDCTITPGKDPGKSGPVRKPNLACWRCKASCYRKPAGPIRKTCLAYCADELC
jgi:hypothetical protein